MLRTFSKVAYVLGLVSLAFLLVIFIAAGVKDADGLNAINMTHFFQAFVIPAAFFLVAVVGRYISD